MSSTLDELEAIERAARGGHSGVSPQSHYPGAMPGSSQMNPRGDDLLVDFPTSRGTRYADLDEDAGAKPPSSTASSGVPRQSSFTMGESLDDGLRGHESDDDAKKTSKPLPGAPLNSYMQRPSYYSDGGGVGGPNHRPLVGGFAAAAYEAARADHYQKQAALARARKTPLPKRTGPPPSI